MTTIINSLKSLKKILEQKKPSKIVLVSSDYLISKLNWAVKEIEKIAGGKITIINIPNGERAKEWVILEKLLNNFARAGLDRKSIIIALGGGSVTDLVGFAASIYQRGISYINIPTTLLGMVDSSIGGKTAINFQGYKNQIGSFYDPISIVIDVRFLKTLKKEQIIDGLAEIIKVGLIKDASILKIIESRSLPELARPSIIGKLIKKSIKVKEYFIGKDPEDRGARQILNFGHTVGHALELKYSLSHGQAVLIGMLKELEVGEKLGETKKDVKIYLTEILRKLNILIDNKQFKIERNFILRDKKVLGEKINFPIIKGEGEAKLNKIKLDKLISLL